MLKFSAALLPIVLAFSCSASLAQAESWQDLTRQGEASLISERMSEAYKYFKNAMTEAEKQKVAATDPTFRTLMLEDIPNLIERLSLEKSNERAEDLAKTKLAFAERLYGDKAPLTLDALQDLQALYSLQKRNLEMTQVLMRYAGTVTALRDEGKENEVNDMLQYRNDRLKRKLKESFERISKRFVPVNKAALPSKEESVKPQPPVETPQATAKPDPKH